MLLVASVLIFRSYEMLLAPTLRVEDGAQVFAYFYNHREWSTLFRFKQGYIPLLPNVIGFASVRFPVTLSPYVLTVAPLLEALLGFVLLFARGFRVYFREDALRFALCLALVLMPVGSFHQISHTDFSIWTSLLVAFFLSLLPVPKGTLHAVGLWLAAQPFIWTNPTAIAIAPIHAAHLAFARNWRTRAFRLVWLLGHVAHFMFGLESGTSTHLSALVDPTFLFELAGQTWSYVASAAFKAVFGRDVWGSVLDNHPLVIDLSMAGFLLFVLAVALFRRRRGARFFLLATLYFVFALTALIALTRAHGMAQLRYRYVQSLLIIVLLVASCATALNHPALGRVRRFWPALAAVTLVLVAVLNVAEYEYHSYRDRFVENGERVRRCMENIAAHEAEQGGRPCGFRLVCKKAKDWPIRIAPPPCP